MKHKRIGIAATTSLILVLAACGTPQASAPSPPSETQGQSEPANASEPATGELTTVRVGTIPIVHAVPLVLGVEEGFFAEEGLDVQYDTAAGGAAIIPGLTSGNYEFGLANPVSPMLAAAQGLDIVIVADADFAEDNPPTTEDGWIEAPDSVLVRGDSGIESAEDLNGKTIAVNTFGGIAELTIRSAGDSLGADSSTFNLVEVGFPDMLSALDSEAVDAIVVSEPFITIARNSGRDYRALFSYMSEAGPNLPGDVYFSTGEYVEENPEIVAAFVRAVNRANAYAQNNPDEARAALSVYTAIEEDITGELFLPTWASEEDAPFNFTGLEALADLMAEYGIVDDELDVEGMTRLPSE